MTAKKKTKDAQFKNFSRLETIPFEQFLKLLERHFSSEQINQHVAGPKWSTWAHTFNHNIGLAFVDAGIIIQGTRIYAGQSLAARLERLQSISQHTNEMLKLLTGEEGRESESIENISDDIWFYLHKNALATPSPDNILSIIRQLRNITDSAICEMKAEIVAQNNVDSVPDQSAGVNKDTIRPNSKPGRKRNRYTEYLFKELMAVWKDLTGTAPSFGVKNGKSTSDFALFFADYFSPNGPSARSISDLCLSLKHNQQKVRSKNS